LAIGECQNSQSGESRDRSYVIIVEICPDQSRMNNIASRSPKVGQIVVVADKTPFRLD
jgi:hypothetical protein